MLSKGDYVKIASVLRAERDRLHGLREHSVPVQDPVILAAASINTVAQQLAEVFEAANPRFDRRRFLEAVNGR